MRASLTELNKYVVAASEQTISSNTYGTIRGLIPPASPLNMLLAFSEGDEDTEVSRKPNGRHSQPMQNFATRTPMQPERSLFAELMARSEGKHQSEDIDRVRGNNSDCEKDNMKALAHRLRSVSLAGISREEQNILTGLAKSLAKQHQILPCLDACGARYALIVECYRDMNPSTSIPSSFIAFALHCSSVYALMDYFIPAPVPRSSGAQSLAKLKFESGKSEQESLWVFSRNIGARWLASTLSSARKLVERVARSEIIRAQKAEHATIWYIAL